MTVPTELCDGNLSWTGVETSYNLGYRAKEAEHVKAKFIAGDDFVTVLTLDTHYSIALDPTTDVATLSPIMLPDDSGTIYHWRETPATQDTDFADLEDFPAETHTDKHDRSAMRDAELKRRVGVVETSTVDAAETATNAAITATNAAGVATAAAAAANDAAYGVLGFRVRLVDVMSKDPDTDYATGDAVDGEVLVAGDVVLRATPGGDPQDGPYVVVASGAASRHPFYQAFDNLPAALFAVADGTHKGVWQCSSDPGGTIDVTDLEFVAGAGGASLTVRVAATANVNIAAGLAEGQTIDGKVLVAGDVVLLPAQTAAAENGFYLVPTIGAAGRVTQFNTFAAHVGKVFVVAEGTTNASSVWISTSGLTGTLGVTALTFARVAGPGGVIATTMSGDVNNFAPAGIHGKTVLRFTSDTAYSVRALTGIDEGLEGEIKIIENNSDTSAMILRDESPNSTDVKRFDLGGGDVWFGPGEAVQVKYNATAHRWTMVSGPEPDSSLFEYLADDALANGNFTLWTVRPASGSVQTAGSGAGFASGAIADGWYGGPGPASQYTFSRLLDDAARGTYAAQFVWNASVNAGETHHSFAGEITSGYWRFSFLENIGRLAPEYVAGQTITIEFDAMSTTPAPTLVPIAWISMGNSAWTAATPVYLDDIVMSDSPNGESGPRLYRCTTAGTTAGSGGPTGAGTGITDGTAVWAYVGELKGREFELYEAGATPTTQQIARGDPHANARCVISATWATYRRQIYIPALNEGSGTRYAGRVKDSGVRTLTPPKGLGAYYGIGFDLYHNAATGPTIKLRNVRHWVGARPKPKPVKWPRELALLQANGIARIFALYGSSSETAAETVIASAGTVDIGGATTQRVAISGTTTITSFGSTPNKIRHVRFTGAGLTLTHGGTLFLPDSKNIATELNDTAIFGSDGSGNWMCLAYKRQRGALVRAGKTFTEGTLASAATTDIGGQLVDRLQITGTTTITSLGTGADLVRRLRFAGALTLTHDATTLILPGGVNILTAAGDTAVFESDASGNWRCLSYTRADGSVSVIRAANVKQAVDTAGNGFVMERSGTTDKFQYYIGGDNNLYIQFNGGGSGYLRVEPTGAPLMAANVAVPAGGLAGLGYKMSSTSNFGMFYGSGVPTLSAAKGSLYLRTDGSSASTRMYVNTDGGTTWTNLVTAL